MLMMTVPVRVATWFLACQAEYAELSMDIQLSLRALPHLLMDASLKCVNERSRPERSKSDSQTKTYPQAKFLAMVSASTSLPHVAANLEVEPSPLHAKLG